MKSKLAIIMLLVISVCACLAGCGDGKTAADIEGEYVLGEVWVEKESMSDELAYNVDELDGIEDADLKECLTQIAAIYSQYKCSIKVTEKNDVKIESYELTNDGKWATVYAHTSTVYFKEESPNSYYMDVPDSARGDFLGGYYNTVGLRVDVRDDAYYVSVSHSSYNYFGIPSPVDRVYSMTYNYYLAGAKYVKVAN